MADNDIVYTLRVVADSQTGSAQLGQDVQNASQQAQQAVNQLNGTLQAQNEWFKQTSQSVAQANEAQKAATTSTTNLADAVEKLAGKYDPLVKAASTYASEMALLDKALADGQISHTAYADTARLVEGAMNAAEQKATSMGKSVNVLGMSANMTVRELRAMADELASGRYSQFDGTLINVLSHVAQANSGFLLLGGSIAAVAAIIGTFVAAAIMGSEEQQKFNEALILTNNYAGQTTDGMRQLATQISDAGGRISTAKEAILDMAASGKFTADNFALIATAATEMADVTGEDVGKIIQQFEKLGESPVQASAKLNEQYHYLTEAIFEQIDALEQHGQKVEAADLAEKAYADAMTDRAAQIRDQLGYIQRAWLGVKEIASEAWNAMLNIGKPTTVQDQLRDVEQKLNDARNGNAKNANFIGMFGNGEFGAGPGGGADTDTAALELQKQALQHKLASQEATAAQKSYNDQLQQEGIAAEAAVRAQENHARGIDLVTQKLKEYHDQLDIIRKSNPNSDLLDPTRVSEHDAYLKQRFGQKPNRAGAQEGRAQTGADVSGVKDDLALENDAYRNSAQDLKQALSDKSMSQQEYYDKTIALIAQHLQAVITADEREKQILQSAADGSTGAQRINYLKQLAQVQRDEMKAGQDAAHAAQEAARQNQDAIDKETAARQSFANALQKENDTRQQGIDKQVASVGMGTREAALYQQLNAIQQEYNQKMQQLATQLAGHQISQSTYDADASTLQTQMDQAVTIVKNGYDRMTQAQNDWVAGVKAGFQNFSDSANDTAKTAEQAFNQFATGAANAIVQFATTGKGSFDQLALSIIQDILRMEVQAAESKILGLIGSFIGAAFGGASGSEAAGASATSTPDDLITGYGHHTGGIAGGDYSTFTNQYPSSLWSGASRYHTGGIVDGEVPIIAQQGEAVMPTVRLPNGQLGVQMAGGGSNSDNGGGVQVQVPISLQVTYQASGSGGNSQNDMNDFSNTIATQIQQAVDQRIQHWAQDQIRPGGALSGTQQGRFGGG